MARALSEYVTGNPSHPLIICDDVLTTGKSMEEVKRGIMWNGPIYGVVLFSRIPHTPMWIKPIFQMPDWQFPDEETAST